MNSFNNDVCITRCNAKTQDNTSQTVGTLDISISNSPPSAISSTMPTSPTTKARERVLQVGLWSADPKELGGLGVINIKNINAALRVRWAWSLPTEEKSWSSLASPLDES
jgi:hypothetical protein